MTPKAQIEYKPLGALRELPGNPRTIKKDQFLRIEPGEISPAGRANHRDDQRQNTRNREEIQPASATGHIQRNLPLIEQELNEIKTDIEAESVSYSQLAFLAAHEDEIIELGDQALAEWAGIPEEEWNAKTAERSI